MWREHTRLSRSLLSSPLFPHLSLSSSSAAGSEGETLGLLPSNCILIHTNLHRYLATSIMTISHIELTPRHHATVLYRQEACLQEAYFRPPCSAICLSSTWKPKGHKMEVGRQTGKCTFSLHCHTLIRLSVTFWRLQRPHRHPASPS